MLSLSQIFLAAFFLCCSGLWFYYLFYVGKLAFFKEKQSVESFSSGISVLICARNEALNLKKNLPFVFNQKYPEFEVLVVDDGSTDASAEILKELAKEFSCLRIITVEPKEKGERKGKKYPLTVAVKNAKYEHLLMIDADCWPLSDEWLQGMANGFSNNKEIVLGFGKYEKKAGFLNQLIQWDTINVATQYFSFALMGQPYMGVGRNLGYTKSVFDRVGGFEKHSHLASGDDDLFIMEAATPKNTAIILAVKTHTISRSKDDFSDWFKQKSRHLTTSKEYKQSIRVPISLVNLAVLLWPMLFMVNLILHKYLLVVFILGVWTTVLHYYIFNFVFKKLSTGANLILSVIFGNVLMLLGLAMFITNKLNKRNKW